jgi:BirA family transcriptional regulator, biotin operon repressor / biotin---[acetyl-CoA-carboxylase] ligase
MEHSWPIVHLNSIGSTNAYALGLLNTNELDHETVINTRAQLQGRGQAGNSWESEPCMNLTFTLVLKPTYIQATEQFLIAQVISLAISEFLKLKKITSWIKWPNDILVGNKKIAGILIENSVMGSVIQHSLIGIGLNVNQENFSSGVPNAISMKNITAIDYNLDFILHELLNCLHLRIEDLKNSTKEKLRNDYLNNLYLYNKWGNFSDGKNVFKGIIKDVLPTGELIIADTHGKYLSFLHKEVIFL